MPPDVVATYDLEDLPDEFELRVGDIVTVRENRLVMNPLTDPDLLANVAAHDVEEALLREGIATTRLSAAGVAGLFTYDLEFQLRVDSIELSEARAQEVQEAGWAWLAHMIGAILVGLVWGFAVVKPSLEIVRIFGSDAADTFKTVAIAGVLVLALVLLIAKTGK
jgi:hypothetical protein